MSGEVAKRRRLSSEQVGDRITAAAIEVFAANGWAGFTFEAIGNASGVGKSSLYKRYRSREELVLSLIDANLFDGEGIDTGSTDGDLRQLCHAYAAWLDGPGGRLSLRFFLEDRLNDDFRAVWEQSARPATASASLFRLIEKGKARGDLDDRASTEVILHSLLGGVVQQLAASPLASGTVFQSDSGTRYLDELVDGVLRAYAKR